MSVLYTDCWFYPRDAMLARLLAAALCLSVCHKSELYQNGWMNWAGFGMGASFHPSYSILKCNYGRPIFKNNGILDSETLFFLICWCRCGTTFSSNVMWAKVKDNKKLSYRRGTARCVVSIEILLTAMQQCRNHLYDKSWPNRWYEVGDLVGGNAW